MVMKRLFSTFLLFFAYTAQALQGTVVDVLCRLEARAAQSQTTSLLIVRQGKPVYRYCNGNDFPCMDVHEILRPIFALTFSRLVDERYITSLDTLVSTFCPEWQQEPYTNTTIRSLLASEDSAFFFLGDVIKAITGEEWHNYTQNALFSPLGIKRDCWKMNNEGKYRLCLSAPDLAKIGLLLAHNGEHNAKQLLSRHWLGILKTPTTHLDPFFSMQWYLEYFDFSTYWDSSLLKCYRNNGVSSSVINDLTALNGRVVHFGGLAIRGKLVHAWGPDIFCALGGQSGLMSLISETHCKHLPLGYFNGGGVKSFVGWGTGGQQLIIIPGKDIVAVRQTCHLHCEDTFEDFIEILDDYIAEVDCYID